MKFEHLPYFLTVILLKLGIDLLYKVVQGMEDYCTRTYIAGENKEDFLYWKRKGLNAPEIIFKIEGASGLLRVLKEVSENI